MPEQQGTHATVWAFENTDRKRRLNEWYVYVINLAHSILEFFPGPVRRFVLQRALASCGRGVFVDHKVYVKFPWLVQIGDRVSINRGVEFYPDIMSGSQIVLGSDVYVGPHARFHASGHDLENLEQHVGGTIRVGDGCWIGAGALILPGVSIGDSSVIGAGAVVARDIPPAVIAVGVPARAIRSIDN